MSKLLSPADIQYSQNQVNSNITIDSSSNGLSIVQYQQSSDGEVQSSAYYNALNHLFYKSHYYGGNCTSTNKGTLYSYTQEAPNPQHKNKFHNSGILYSISGSIYGERVKPHSFSLTASDGGTDIAIRDDGYGNLYPTNTTGNLILSQSGVTSISSSDNYVGNIFYEHGLVVLTESSSYKGGWDLNDITFTTSSPTVTSENNLPHGVFFKPDGTKYFMIGSQGSAEGIFEYEMSTAWDVSTATYTGNKLDMTNPNWTADAWRSVTFSPDGTKIWTTNEDADNVKEWNLDIAWDVTSWDSSAKGSMTNFATDGGISETIENQPHGHAFSQDGYKLYIVGAGKNTVFEYDLQDAYSIANVTYNYKKFNVSESLAGGTDEDEINGISFSPDGTRMFTAGNGRNMVYQHKLSTAWDVSTATFVSELDISGKETQIHDVQWKPDGTKMYIIGHGSDAVHQYDSPSNFYTNLTGSVSMSFESTTTINTMEINCVLEANEYNTTSNPTVLYSGSIETTKFNDSRAYENPLSTGGQNYEYNTMEQLNIGLPSYHQSGSIRNVKDYTIKPLFRTNEFKTYISKIGIYNQENELIMIAGLPSPIQKLMNQKMTFKIQIDL